MKTMSGLSAKGQKTERSIFDTIVKTHKKIPEYCHNSEQGKLRRYTPMEHQSTSEGMKNRMARGEYSSGRKQFSTETGYEMLPEFNQGSKVATHDSTNEYVNTVSKLYLDSNADEADIRDEFYLDEFVGFDDSAKLNKPPEEDDIYIEESLTTVLTQSAETTDAEDRSLNKETEEQHFNGATGGKKVDNRDWIKENKPNRFLKGITRFFQKSTYLCGCRDDLDFK